jgi:hypothetical protein
MITLQWDEIALEFLHEEIPGTERLTPVFSIHNGEYEWKQMMALFSSETKTFHWLQSAGCSCCENLFSHVKSADDLVCGNERELKQALRSFLSQNPTILDNSEKERIFSKIKKQT